MTEPVYLDNAATTPLDPRVLESMLAHLGGRRGNPSSLHAFGGSAREEVEEARDSVASLIGALPGEIVLPAEEPNPITWPSSAWRDPQALKSGTW